MILNALKFLAKIRGNHKIVKKETNSISISVFGYEKKEKQPIYYHKNFAKKSFIANRRKRQKIIGFYQRFRYIHL